MCANARNKSQHVGSLDEKTKDSGTFSISDAIFNSRSHVDAWHVVRVHRRNIVGCAVQTNATLLDHASITAKQQKCRHLLALKFDQFQTSSNNFQQVATTHNMVCKRSQQVGPNNVASCWPTMFRAFARAFTLTRRGFKIQQIPPKFAKTRGCNDLSHFTIFRHFFVVLNRPERASDFN